MLGFSIGVQVYLLSVFTTIAAGATLAAGYLVKRFPVLEPLKRFAASSRAAGTLGTIAAAVGFVKLFTRAPGQTIIVFADNFLPVVAGMLGDYLPAFAGMLLGGMLMIDRYRERRRLDDSAAEQVTADDGDDEGDALPVTPAAGIVKIGDALAPYRTLLGLAGIAAGVIQFLLAGALFV